MKLPNRELTAALEDGFSLFGYSQGGVLARALLLADAQVKRDAQDAEETEGRDARRY